MPSPARTGDFERASHSLAQETGRLSSMPTDQPSPQSAIVFGGAGFIGSRLLALLAERGTNRLVSVDIKAPSRPVEGVDYRTGDLRARVELQEHFDVIYNLAAVHTTPGHEPHEYYEANVGGAINVTEFARDNDIGTIVFTSSISVYGPGEELKDESTPPAPTSDYGKSKLLAEHIHRTWLAEKAGRRLVIARPAVVFGHGEGGNFERMLNLIRSRRFVYPGRTDTIKSCGYVGELVQTFEWALAQGEREVLYNFAYPERTTIEEIASTVARVDGDPIPKVNLPFNAMMRAARAFEMAAAAGLRTGINRERLLKLVRSTNVYPAYLVDQGYNYGTRLRTAVEEWIEEERENARAI